MTDWSRGYVSDSPYTTSFQGFFAPPWLEAVCALMGIAWTEPADCAIAELGCGRGYTASVLAAADPRRQVFGFDYNPAHIAEARELATLAGIANARFVEADLAAIGEAELDRLPEFDVIGLHGVWTWVADPVREGILRFVSRRLKPGGLLYLGYNAMPGFGPDHGLQRLIRAAAAQASGDSIARVQAAADVAGRLAAAEAVQLHSTGLMRRVIDPKDRPDASYLAHEFLTDHWRPAFFADVAATFAAAKCAYVGSATLWENLPDLVFNALQRAEYEAFADPIARELVKDLCMSRGFRRDVFVRGGRQVLREPALDRLVVALTVAPPDSVPKLGVQHGSAELPAEMAAPILAALAEGPQTIGRLRLLPQTRRPNAAELTVLLLSTGLCAPVRPDAPAAPAARRFNAVAAGLYADAGRSKAGLAFASPLAGGGLPCASLELAVGGWLAEGGDPATPPADIARVLLPFVTDQEATDVGGFVGQVLTDRLAVWQRFGVFG